MCNPIFLSVCVCICANAHVNENNFSAHIPVLELAEGGVYLWYNTAQYSFTFHVGKAV